MLQKTLNQPDFNCVTDYALETINSINFDRLIDFFGNLSSDPYLKENYRFRHLSRFQVTDDQIVKLPHDCLFQSKNHNPLLGDLVREYGEIEDELVNLTDFGQIIRKFAAFCQLCSSHNEIAVHQIRTTTSAQQIGQLAPEGIHRDGVDLIGIFCVNRERIEGGTTSLYRSQNGSPLLSKILEPGEFLIFNDNQFFHYTSPITTVTFPEGFRDVFVLTCPGLLPPKG